MWTSPTRHPFPCCSALTPKPVPELPPPSCPCRAIPPGPQSVMERLGHALEGGCSPPRPPGKKPRSPTSISLISLLPPRQEGDSWLLLKKKTLDGFCLSCAQSFPPCLPQTFGCSSLLPPSPMLFPLFSWSRARRFFELCPGRARTPHPSSSPRRSLLQARRCLSRTPLSSPRHPQISLRAAPRPQALPTQLGLGWVGLGQPNPSALSGAGSFPQLLSPPPRLEAFPSVSGGRKGKTTGRKAASEPGRPELILPPNGSPGAGARAESPPLYLCTMLHLVVRHRKKW